MLVELAITDFAIIDQLRLTFEPGLNGLTGETGAGKSIIIDALGAVLGERIGSDVVRTGARAARVEAIFAVDERPASDPLAVELVELGITLDDDSLILSREITAQGRSTARINGRAVPVSVLGRLGTQLVDIHGQSDHLSLLRSSAQLNALDRFAGLGGVRAEMAVRVRDLRAIRLQIASIESGSRDREQRVDLLSYQSEEIDGAGLVVGEDDVLVAERSVLANAEKIASDVERALLALEGLDEDGGLASLRKAQMAVAGVSDVDANAAGLSEQIGEVVILAQELATDLTRYASTIQANPERLRAIDDRIEVIRRLKRKYGATIEDVMAFQEQVQSELESLTGRDVDAASLKEDERRLASQASSTASRLSRGRFDASKRLGDAVAAGISELNMGRAEFAVAITCRPDPDGLEVDGDRVGIDETGIDRVEFMLAPNAGEALKPLAKVASGGETARLMLALTSVLASGDATPTLVFDEVDVGVGARSGQVVGEKLWGLTGHHQVLVITHLAQIAAFADTHFNITKAERAGRTVSNVDRLEGEERELEIAAMLDGLPVTPEAAANARQLVQRVETWKRTSR